jgi:hypothetical protein
MQFFGHCKTLQEIKETYRNLAKQHHPDRGGSKEMMQAINVEYEFATASMLKKGSFSQEDTDKEMNFSKAYQEAIDAIINLPDITIELVGWWIWVTGNTYPVREILHTAKFHWAPQKKAWYFHTEEFKVLRGSNKSLDEIKDKYGSKPISERNQKRKLNKTKQ